MTVTTSDLGALMADELASQPQMWARAADLASSPGALPPHGQRIAVVGCGTSWFIAQAYAGLRESGGFGETDAFTASEMPTARSYDAVVALTRSGTTTEVLELVDALRGRTPVYGVVGDTSSPFVDVVDHLVALPFADERSVVQTRFATAALALMRASLGASLAPVIQQAVVALDEHLDEQLVASEQFTFLGAGWSIGLAHEAALKMREAAQWWTESYVAKEYRHGPISIAAPGRTTWVLGDPPAGLADEVRATGARFEHSGLDPMVDLLRVHRVALEKARRAGLNPDLPRHLTRSVVLPA